MRSGQQNKRGRGRGNNNNNFNRKGANPLTRTYDSTGPDVKVRGTAQHIAEKYMSLARDAQSAGDRVMAENYLQHAEHYNRIIASAQAQLQERYQRDDRDNDDEDDNNNASSARNNNQGNDRNERNERRDQQPRRQEASVDADGPQPVIDGTPAEVAAEEADGQPVEKGRRRSAAASRPRRTKRAAAEAAGENAGNDSAAAEADASADEGEAPKKPARRRRAPKAEAKDNDASEKPAMADAASE
ncbi:DUF4167 domain-containing protein [Martelella endophytica]|uniref:DUF4167 domain-containing protein n=1 Tax=Martelella endophytica TaxID=1486262 RepID=A0A0D5LN92_MAREN|nr:DUF4167 domain-containing protein [Martelella endophytica]AJY44783.1 hypothetical protein TM49_02360 [Martelella endophytica]